MKAEGELAEVRKAEMEKKHRFEMLAQSLNDQISTQTRDQATAQATLEAKQEAVGEAQGDLAATSKTLGEDKKFLSKSEQTCAASASRNEENNQARAAELEALNQAIQILSGDKFVAAAGRRLPGESFLQTSSRSVKPAVVRLLQRVASRTHSEQIALLAQQVSADPFGKVRGLISGMLDKLQDEAAQEQEHNEYCVTEKAKSDKKQEKFINRVEEQSTRIDKATAGVATLKEDIATLSGEVAAADKSLAEQTQLRHDENSEIGRASCRERV